MARRAVLMPTPVAGGIPGWEHQGYEEVTMEALGHVCSRCHGQAVFGFGATWLCEDCYGVIGSCCMEFDGDDMFLEDRSWWESRMVPKP